MQKIKWKGHLKQIFRQTAKIERPLADQKKATQRQVFHEIVKRKKEPNWAKNTGSMCKISISS